MTLRVGVRQSDAAWGGVYFSECVRPNDAKPSRGRRFLRRAMGTA